DGHGDLLALLAVVGRARLAQIVEPVAAHRGHAILARPQILDDKRAVLLRPHAVAAPAEATLRDRLRVDVHADHRFALVVDHGARDRAAVVEDQILLERLVRLEVDLEALDRPVAGLARDLDLVRARLQALHRVRAVARARVAAPARLVACRTARAARPHV